MKRKAVNEGLAFKRNGTCSFEEGYVRPHIFNPRQSVRIRRFSLEIKYENKKGNNDDIDRNGGGTEKTQERINITLESSRDACGSSIVTEPVPREGDTGLEVHLINPTGTNNKR